MIYLLIISNRHLFKNNFIFFWSASNSRRRGNVQRFNCHSHSLVGATSISFMTHASRPGCNYVCGLVSAVGF